MSIVDIVTSLVGVSGAVFGFTQWLITRHDKRVTITREEFNALRQAIKDLAFMRLEDRYYFYMDRGWASLNEKSAYECLYKSYHKLGGNGIGTEMYNQIKTLPTAPPDAIYSNKQV